MCQLSLSFGGFISYVLCFFAIVPLLHNYTGIMQEPIDYGDLEKSIRECTTNKGLEDIQGFINKCIQLYETTVVRHGLMLVGPTISGKTKCYEVLRDALSALKGKTTPGGVPFETVHTYVLNPKAITMGQLYGEFDPLTHEW